MPVVNIKSIKPKVWIPPIYGAIFKLTVTRSDSTVDDVTDLVTEYEIEDVATTGIGRFSFTLPNPNEDYTGVWTGMEIVRYYSDYDTAATSLRFRGRVEKVSYIGNQVKVIGRAESLIVQDITVTQTYSAEDTSNIVIDLFSKYAPGFSTAGVETSGVTLTVNWYQKPFWECIQECCTAAGFDCFIDASLVVQYFQDGSRVNNDEGIVHDHNLLEISDFAEDLSQIKNRVIVYGAIQEGIQVIYTAEDDTSQSDYEIKEEIINDENITEYTQAQELGDFRLAQLKDPPVVGDITSVMLATILPGQKMWMSAPLDNLPPDKYKVISYVHTWSQDEGYKTKVRIEKEPRKISHIIRDRIEAEGKKKITASNPFEMRYAYNFLFESDSGTHSNTAISNNVLYPTAASGNWTSDARGLDENVTDCYLIATGETLTGVSFEVSGDGGTNWESINNKEKITLSTSIGKFLMVRVTFSNADTQIQSLSVQYKTE